MIPINKRVTPPDRKFTPRKADFDAMKRDDIRFADASKDDVANLRAYISTYSRRTGRRFRTWKGEHEGAAGIFIKRTA